MRQKWLEVVNNWEIRKLQSGVYSIGGYGLGLLEAELHSGLWYYDEQLHAFEPADTFARALLLELTTTQAQSLKKSSE